MIELYGNAQCTSCKQALAELAKVPIDFRYVDVATIQFTGEIPLLKLETGAELIGLGQIMNFIKDWKRENGFV